MGDTAADGEQKECPKCGLTVTPLKDVSNSDWTKHDEVCGRCIVEHSKQYGRCNLDGQKTAAEQRREWLRASEHVRNGSGWP